MGGRRRRSDLGGTSRPGAQSGPSGGAAQKMPFPPKAVPIHATLQGSRPGFGVLTSVQMEGEGPEGLGSAEARLPDQTSDWLSAHRKDRGEEVAEMEATVGGTATCRRSLECPSTHTLHPISFKFRTHGQADGTLFRGHLSPRRQLSLRPPGPTQQEFMASRLRKSEFQGWDFTTGIWGAQGESMAEISRGNTASPTPVPWLPQVFPSKGPLGPVPPSCVPWDLRNARDQTLIPSDGAGGRSLGLSGKS